LGSFTEVQELRHQAEANAPAASTFTGSIPGETGDGPTTSSPGGTGITTLDQALMGLEERLEAISGSIASIDETLEPHLNDRDTPTRATPNMSSGGELTDCTAAEARRIEGRVGQRSEGSRNAPERIAGRQVASRLSVSWRAVGYNDELVGEGSSKLSGG
jgi:hypothetical protein